MLLSRPLSHTIPPLFSQYDPASRLPILSSEPFFRFLFLSFSVSLTRSPAWQLVQKKRVRGRGAKNRMEAETSILPHTDWKMEEKGGKTFFCCLVVLLRRLHFYLNLRLFVVVVRKSLFLAPYLHGQIYKVFPSRSNVRTPARRKRGGIQFSE